MISFLFTLLSFFLPFQLSYHFRSLSTPVLGFNIDYLIPTLYISDIFVLLIIFSFLRKSKIKFQNKHIAFILSYITFIILNLYNSKFALAGIYKWIKLTEFISLALIIRREKSIKVFDHFVKPLSYSILIVCILAIWQYINRGSIGGAFYLLGERYLRFSDPGVKPFPYSTFSHPNSLAGFLLVFLFLLYGFKNNLYHWYFKISTLLIVITIFLTNSVNVYIAAVLSFVFYKLKIKPVPILVLVLIFSLLLPFVSSGFFLDKSIIERIDLAKASFLIFMKSPVLGIGFNNFIPSLVNTKMLFENSWQLQPVHNIFLLIISETGVIGLSLVISFLLLNPIFFIFIPIFLTSLLDHYWLTLQQNSLLLTMVIGFSSDIIKRWKKR